MTGVSGRGRSSGADAARMPRVPSPRLSTGETTTELSRRFPPRAVPASWPATQASRHQVSSRLLAPPFAMDNILSQRNRRLGLIATLNWLEAQPGRTWQDRWIASGAQSHADWRLLVPRSGVGSKHDGNPERRVAHLVSGLLPLICGDVIRPSVGWLLTCPPAPRNLAAEMARARDTAGFAALTALCDTDAVGADARRVALTRIAVVMAAKGGLVDDITVGDCVELLDVTAALRTGPDRHSHSPFFYQLLRALGGFGEAAPATMRVLQARGQLTAEELIDRYGIACQPVRDLLVDYLRERQLTVDYSSLQNLAYALGKLFWRDLETHHRGIDSLWLNSDVAAAWKQRVMTKATRVATPGGIVESQTPRLNGRNLLTTVRSFYLDLAQWAVEDPARWGPWVASCPIRAAELSHTKDRRQRKSRMDQRTRERLPVLTSLVSWVDRERNAAAQRLRAAQASDPGQEFAAGGQVFRRSVMATRTTTRIWADDPGTGKRRDLTFEEHRAFWTWATVEILRLTGIRIEELTELSHHSLIQYTLPATGELVPLLQIAPSKTDAERLLVISPELADVLATVIARIRAGGATVPLVVSYDSSERAYNPPMPLLFQWRCRLEHRPISTTTLRDGLDHALARSGLTDAAGKPLRFAPHDFRRLFITDAIVHGLPPHIAQLVAGHRDISTTMGYKAVYPEDVINGHRAFIARRRELRPSEEYRTPTDAEWEEFLGHFERRKLSLGTCGRAFGNSCIHEHACIRCSLLRPDPGQRPRLVEIRDNLIARISEAREQGWLGDIEGLNVSLAAAQQKLAQTEEILARRRVVHLGVPTFPDIAGRTATTTAGCS